VTELVRRLTASCALLLLPLAAAAYAQETTGTILGVLRDQTDAVLPGVKVVAVSVGTGQARDTVTNNVGQYALRLPVGNYDISFQLPSFQPFTARGISLHVNDRLQVNGKLVVGAIETLTVTAERLVQPTSAVQTLIDPVAIRELPLLTRTPVQLVTLVPGVSSDLREDACFCDQGNLDISINGARRSAVNWLLDGASNQNGWNNYTLVTTPSLEAIQEINVITSTYSAEWARNGGGVVNVVTRTGMNRFSGGAYGFLRNDALNAVPFLRSFDSRATVNDTPARLRYNDIGHTLGGPALPSREKLFFFFSQEWRRTSGARRSLISLVPDPHWLTDPAHRNYVAPEDRHPNSMRLLTLWPAPNVAGTNRYQATLTSELDTRQEFVRADYNVVGDWSLGGRYLHDRVDSRGDYSTGPERTPGHRYSLGRVAIIEARRAGDRFLFESSSQLSRHVQSQRDVSPTRADLGLEIPEVFPENAANLMPLVQVAGLSALGGLQLRPREYLNYTFSSALAVQQGAHAFKAGGLFALEHVNSNLVPELTHGQFMFLPGGGFTAFQNFIRGNAGGGCGASCTYSETDIDVVNQFRSRRYELYAQDTWRITPTLTLDLGLRYALYPALIDDRDMLFTFSPAAYDRTQAPTFADEDGFNVVRGTGDRFNGLHVAGRNSPHGRAITGTDTNNVQPRLGAAWDPSGAGRLIVRAGYGVYFDQTQAAMFVENVQSSFHDPFRTEIVIGNPSQWTPLGGTVSEPVTRPTPLAFATSEEMVAPRWQHWNVGVQRRLYAGGAVDAGYVGSRGDHLLRYVDINKPQPEEFIRQNGAGPNPVRPFLGYDRIIMRETTARSRYHGLAVGFRHDGGGGLSATASYTLSRTMADATYDNSQIDDPQNPLDRDAEFAPAGTDRTHVLTASYVYELPFARGAAGRWRASLLGGWQIAGITRVESGPPVRIQTINCNYGGWCFPGAQRPDQIGDPGAGSQDGLLWFNPAAFTPSPAGEYGNAAVAPFRLPGRHQWDIALSKNVGLTATQRLQVRLDVINVFNQRQIAGVNTTCGGAGQCDARNGFGEFTSARPPREVQIGVRWDW
jgi:hypothetical protein